MNVSRQLGELQIGMRQLVESSKSSQASNTSPIAASSSQDFPTTHINGGHPDASAVFEGYKGESSFNTYVKQVTDSLEGAFDGTADSDPSMASAVMHDLLQDVDTAQSAAPETNDSSRTNLNLRYPELENLSLPLTQPVLKLLRLAQAEKQRFFTDVPFIDEQDFVEDCKSVYFATESYSLWTWIVINIGLLYLFLDLDAKHYAQLALDAADIGKIVRLLSGNADAACPCIRLCLEPSIPACRAIALLVRKQIDSGRIRFDHTLTNAGNVLYQDRTQYDRMETDQCSCTDVS